MAVVDYLKVEREKHLKLNKATISKRNKLDKQRDHLLQVIGKKKYGICLELFHLFTMEWYEPGAIIEMSNSLLYVLSPPKYCKDLERGFGQWNTSVLFENKIIPTSTDVTCSNDILYYVINRTSNRIFVSA